MGQFPFSLMRASDVATPGQRLVLFYDECLQFASYVLAKLFDTLHEIMWDDIPDETDWMAAKMIEIVRAGNANEEGLFAGTEAEYPAVGPAG